MRTFLCTLLFITAALTNAQTVIYVGGRTENIAYRNSTAGYVISGMCFMEDSRFRDERNGW